MRASHQPVMFHCLLLIGYCLKLLFPLLLVINPPLNSQPANNQQRQPSSGRLGQTSTRNAGLCYNCQKLGHLSANCSLKPQLLTNAEEKFFEENFVEDSQPADEDVEDDHEAFVGYEPNYCFVTKPLFLTSKTIKEDGEDRVFLVLHATFMVNLLS